MQKNILALLFFSIIITTGSALAQTDITLGSTITEQRYGGAYFDYSDPNTLNIKVSVWGYVRHPGRYNIPIYTTPTDLISFAGGPLDNSDLDEIKIYRSREDGSEEVINLNYEDYMEGDNLQNRMRTMVSLKASDIIVVPGGPKYYFRDWLSISLSIFSALVSLTILVLNIQRN